MESEKPIIFFDGVCNLCNGAINFIIDRDPHSYFKFAPLQSDIAKEYIPEDLIQKTDSILYWHSGEISSKSNAALKIAKHLKGGWKMAYGFIIIPKFIRDFFYDLVARNRYSWFGKRDSCRMPTQDIKDRFLKMD